MTTGAGHERPPASGLVPGQRVGRYEVVCRLASGGMAELYLARAHGAGGFGKDVVLKRILPHIAEDAAFVDLFMSEARLAAAIDHPNVGAVYDVGEAGGLPFFAMEYVHGEDLGFMLQEFERRGLRLPLASALSIVCGVAAGLHAAHETRGPDGAPLGIVHRDVSPSNVLVTYAGGVKLIDFGIARATARDGHGTAGGALRGKIPYMSPEQCRGKPLDRRSDVFSLGVLLYELTTGARPFEGDSGVATLRKVLEATPEPPGRRVPGYPRALAAVVEKALAKPAELRHQTARELGAALEAFAHEDGLSLSPGALADFMERSFGPKPPPSARAAQVKRTAEFGPLPAPRAEPSESPATRPMRSPAARRRWVTAGLAAAALLVMGAVAGRLGRAPQEPPRPVLVVAERGQVAREPRVPGAAPVGAASQAAGEPPAASATAGAPRKLASLGAPAVSAPAASAPSGAPAVSAPAVSAAAGSADTRPGTRPLARAAKPRGPAAAVARQQRALERCFLRHAGSGAKATRLSVQFRAGRDGRVVAADLLPAAAARTPLGACVLGVARRVRFGPQPAPLAFTIPLSFDVERPDR